MKDEINERIASFIKSNAIQSGFLSKQEIPNDAKAEIL